MNMLIVFVFLCCVRPTGAGQHEDEDINWPKGTYGLPRPIDGCPASKGFTWQEGWIYQDNEDYNSFQTESIANHLGIMVQGKNSNQSFCIKIDETPKHRPWPKGSYCINKKGPCPKGFTKGSIQWNDNICGGNRNSGAHPDGSQWLGRPGTIVEYCCRNDGDTKNEIHLPFEKPFLLYMSEESKECQQVHNMNVKTEWFYWDVEDDHAHRGIIKGTVPFGSFDTFVELYYCYYTKKT